MGKAWYDEFTIQEVEMIATAIDEPTDHGQIIVSDYKLQNNYPNPFNPETIIEYYVPKAGNVSVVIYNIMGQKVRTLVDRDHTMGNHYAVWNGRDDDGNLVASGVYFYQLNGQDAVVTKKMTLVR
jgi:hypothetical protein